MEANIKNDVHYAQWLQQCQLQTNNKKLHHKRDSAMLDTQETSVNTVIMSMTPSALQRMHKRSKPAESRRTTRTSRATWVCILHCFGC